MTSISSEGKMLQMRLRNSTVIILISLMVLLTLFNIILVSPFYISDTNPYSYTSMIILLLPLFFMLGLKEKFKVDLDSNSIILGIVLFVLFMLSDAYLFLAFSFLFISYGIIFITYPLLLASIISLTMGTRSIRRFSSQIAYSIFGSSAVLMPVVALNNQFVLFNTSVVFQIIKLLARNAVYISPITIGLNGSYIGIGNACVDIGAIIAIIFIMVPIAYFYDGRAKDKALWIASSAILLFVLNILRMVSITMLIFYYGASTSILYVHAFAGMLLFYVSMILMLILAGKYNLHLPRLPRSPLTNYGGYAKYGFSLAIIISIIAFYASYIYVSASYAVQYNSGSVSLLNANVSGSGISPSTFISTANYSEYQANASEGISAIYSISAPSSSVKQSILLVTSENSPVKYYIMNGSDTLGELNFINNNGISGSVAYAISNGTRFIVYSSKNPVGFTSGETAAAELILITPYNTSENGSCMMDDSNLYSYIAGFTGYVSNNGSVSRALRWGYCYSSAVIR